MPAAIVRGCRITYERAGAGPPLVLLHGIGSNARSWRHQLAGLSDEFTVVAWDAPGYGGSDDPPADWPLVEYAHHLAGLLDHLGFARVALLGLSWGGVLAQEFYRHYPSRVSALLLADTNAGHGGLDEAERRRRLDDRLRALETMTPAELARARAPALLRQPAPPELLGEVEAIMAELHPRGYRSAAIALSQADTRDVLPQVCVPTLVLCGEQDQVTPLAEARQLASAIPHARLAVIAEAGHVSNQQQPARFNTAVRQFLREALASPAQGAG